MAIGKRGSVTDISPNKKPTGDSVSRSVTTIPRLSKEHQMYRPKYCLRFFSLLGMHFLLTFRVSCRAEVVSICFSLIGIRSFLPNNADFPASDKQNGERNDALQSSPT